MSRPARLRIFTRDPRRAAAFYAQVFGWSLPADGDQRCRVITPSDDTGPIDGPSIPTVHVDDLDATTKAARAAGGEILVPRLPLPRAGWLAYLAGPEIGIMQNDPHARWPDTPPTK
jgi:predicted enzyme related to lactoylglutathione lyase